jgi:HTH-type transcriptional regulator/antitoxin HigA
MDWKVIKTGAAYRKAAKRVTEIFQVVEGKPEADELALLPALVKDYEDKHIKIPRMDPIDLIQRERPQQCARLADLFIILTGQSRNYFLEGLKRLTKLNQ